MQTLQSNKALNASTSAANENGLLIRGLCTTMSASLWCRVRWAIYYGMAAFRVGPFAKSERSVGSGIKMVFERVRLYYCKTIFRSHTLYKNTYLPGPLRRVLSRALSVTPIKTALIYLVRFISIPPFVIYSARFLFRKEISALTNFEKC